MTLEQSPQRLLTQLCGIVDSQGADELLVCPRAYLFNKLIQKYTKVRDAN